MGRSLTLTGKCILLLNFPKRYSLECGPYMWIFKAIELGWEMTYSNLSLHYVSGSCSCVFRGICA